MIYSILNISRNRLWATVVIYCNSRDGIIIDGNIKKVLEKNDNISELNADQFMTKNPKCVRDNLMAIDALYLMQSKKINHLIIIDHKDSYVGVTHILDFINEGLN